MLLHILYLTLKVFYSIAQVQRKSFQYQFPNMVYIFHFGLIFMPLVVTRRYKCSQVFALIGRMILIIMYIHIDIPRNVFCMTTTETWLLSYKNKWSNNKRSFEYHETIWIFDIVYLDTHASKCCNKNFLRANEWMKIIYLRHINILIWSRKINATITNIILISRILHKFHWDLIISYHVCSSWSCQFLLWCMCDNEWEVKVSYAIVNQGTHICCIDYWLNVWTISKPLHHIQFWIGFGVLNK